MAEVITKKGAVLPLHKTGSTTFGTDEDVAVTVAAQFAVAGRHFTIVPENGRYVLKDLGSGFGTQVNSDAVESRPLVHGDKIQAGKLELVFSDPVSNTQKDSQATARPAGAQLPGLALPGQDRAARAEVPVGKKRSLSFGFGKKKKTKLVLPVLPKKKPLPKPLIKREIIRIDVKPDPNNAPRTLVNRVLGRRRKVAVPELKLNPITEKLDVAKADPKSAKEKVLPKVAPKIEPKPELEKAPESLPVPEPVPPVVVPEVVAAVVPVLPVIAQEAPVTEPVIESATVAEEPLRVPVLPKPETIAPKIVAPKVTKPPKPKGPSVTEILAKKRAAIEGAFTKCGDAVSSACRGVGTTVKGIGSAAASSTRTVWSGVRGGAKAAALFTRQLGSAGVRVQTALVVLTKSTRALAVRVTGLALQSSAGAIKRGVAIVAAVKRRATAAKPAPAPVTVEKVEMAPVAAPAPAPVHVEVETVVPTPVPIPVEPSFHPKPAARLIALTPRSKEAAASPLAALHDWWQAIGVGAAFAALTAAVVWDTQNGKIIYGLLSGYSSQQPALVLNDHLDVQPAVASANLRTDYLVTENKELAGTWISTETLYKGAGSPESQGIYPGSAFRFETWGGLKMLTVPGRQDGQPLSDVEAVGLQVHFQASYEILSPGMLLLHTEGGDLMCSAQRKSDGLALAILAADSQEPVAHFYCLPDDQLK
ncbi:MAG: FHA domain-containing protein [Verrucomicrobiales bacterium]